MAVINVQNWNIEQVVDWITGFDPSLSQYAENFTSNAITGEKLLNLMPGDLEYILRIGRIGDQLLLHDAIQTLRDELQTPWTTLQTLSLALSVRCKNYRSELTQQKQRYLETQAREQEQHTHSHHHHHHHTHHHHHSHTLYNNLTTKSNVNKSTSHGSSDRGSSEKGAGSNSTQQNSSIGRLETIPTTSLASASYLLDAGKVLIRWLTRFPFLGKLNYDEISRKLTKHCFELAVLSQRDTFADNAIEEVQYLCTKIIELCEALIHSNDSLGIQPAGIDIITLRKRNEQDWGLQFESSPWGIHQITGVKLSSPAQQSGHLERGDEILQVNYQTVLAWPQPSVISLLHENENEVILTVKRRPRHASTNLLLLGGHQNNMYLNKVPNRKSFFERRAKEERARTTRNERTALLVNQVVIEEDESTAAVIEKPVVVLENVVESTIPVPPVVVEDEEEEEKAAPSDVRFWKLYPKPKYLIKRRATVTGASPTDTRPPVTFINDSTDQTTLDPHPNHRSDPTSSDHPPSYKPHQTVHHRRSTPVTTLTSSTHDPTNTMHLLHPPVPQRPPLDKSRSAPEQDLVQESTKDTTTDTLLDHDTVDDDDVFVTKEIKPQNVPPTPKPRLSRCSTNATVKDEHQVFELNGSIKQHAGLVNPHAPLTKSPAPTTPKTPLSIPIPTPKSPIPTPQPPPIQLPIQLPKSPPPPIQLPKSIISQQKPNNNAPPPPPKVLHRGILHIRSQLRKQSSSNSASALPVMGPNCSLSSSSTTTSLLSSSSPRWIRQNALFYSNRELEIINPVSSSTRSVSVSNSSSLSNNNQNFRVKIGYREGDERGNGIRRDEFNVLAASEVHSRPFAFKITSGDSVTYYLAAESQMELDQWVSVMTTGEVINPPNDPRLRSNNMRTNPLSSVGDSGRKNFARAPYKRSISLGSSQSPTVSYTNLSTPHHHHHHNHPHSSTPPPSLIPPQQKQPTPRFYNSSTNLSTTSLPPPSSRPHHRTSTTPSSYPYNLPTTDSRSSSLLLSRSNSSTLKTSTVKTDWFLRNTTATTNPSSNISSITITSKKVSKSQVSTQYPTPTGTPTKQHHPHPCSTPTTTSTSTPQQQQQPIPMMGVTMKTKKNSTSSGTGSCTTSPTRKYMCPNCRDVTKVDSGTQTEDEETNEQVGTPAGLSGELKLVFFNSGESRV